MSIISGFKYRSGGVPVLANLVLAISEIGLVSQSVCLSVKRVNCNKRKETSAEILIPYETPIHLVFWQEKWLVGVLGENRSLVLEVGTAQNYCKW